MTNDISEALEMARLALKPYPSAYKKIVAHIAKLEAVVEAGKRILGLASGLEDDDPFYFDSRNGHEICDEFANLVTALDSTNVP